MPVETSVETISFNNSYSFIATLLDSPYEDVVATITSEGSDKLLSQLEPILAKAPKLILSDGIKVPGENSDLLAGGSDLSKKTPALIRRQEKVPNIDIGPITVNCDKAVIDYFRSTIVLRLRPIFEKAKSSKVKYLEQILRSVNDEEKEQILHSIVHSTESAITNPQAISYLLETFRHEEWIKSFEAAHQTAVMVKVLFSRYPGARDELGATGEENLCKAALFSDIARMVKPSLYKNDVARHPLRSAQMMEEMGLPASACNTAKMHHKLEDDQGKPILRSGQTQLTTGERLLAVADFFVSALSGGKGLNKDIETIKTMAMMAYEGYIDQKAVKILTELYFSKKLSLFLDKAYELTNLCLFINDTNPILWSILGDKVPYKFICKYDKCPHLGSQPTLISHTIPIGSEVMTVSKIQKGEYKNCRILSERLEKLHKEIAALK